MDYPIGIRCVCGIIYDAQRFPNVKCPKCGHVWVMNPDRKVNIEPLEGKIHE